MSIKTLVELDVHTLNQIRELIRPVVEKVTKGLHLEGTTHAEEIITGIEEGLIESIQVTGTRTHKLSTLVGGDSVYRAGAIKDLLKDVPDDRMILSQIVGSQTGVYNAYFEIGILDRGNGPVVISAGHPELAHLPMCTDSDERNQKINHLIDELNKLR